MVTGKGGNTTRQQQWTSAYPVSTTWLYSHSSLATTHCQSTSKQRPNIPRRVRTDLAVGVWTY